MHFKGDQLHYAMTSFAILQLLRYRNSYTLFQIILWTMSPPIYRILYCLQKAKILMVLQILKTLYKTGSHLAWVNGINGACRSRWLHTIAVLPLKGKFFSSSHSEVQPQIRATINCWGSVCKQHLIFQSSLSR